MEPYSPAEVRRLEGRGNEIRALSSAVTEGGETVLVSAERTSKALYATTFSINTFEDPLFMTRELTTIELCGHDGEVQSCVRLEGSDIVSCSADQTIAVWTDGGKKKQSVSDHEATVAGLAVARRKAGGDLLVSVSLDKTSRIFSALDLGVKGTVMLPDRPLAVSLIPTLHQNRCGVILADSTVCFLDLDSGGSLVPNLSYAKSHFERAPVECCGLHDGKLVVADIKGNLYLLDSLSFRAQHWEFSLVKKVTCLCALPNTLAVAAGINHGKVRIVDFSGNSGVGDSSVAELFTGHKSAVTAINILPGNKSWAIGYEDGSISILPLPRLIRLLMLEGGSLAAAAMVVTAATAVTAAAASASSLTAAPSSGGGGNAAAAAADVLSSVAATFFPVPPPSTLTADEEAYHQRQVKAMAAATIRAAGGTPPPELLPPPPPSSVVTSTAPAAAGAGVAPGPVPAPVDLAPGHGDAETELERLRSQYAELLAEKMGLEGQLGDLKKKEVAAEAERKRHRKLGEELTETKERLAAVIVDKEKFANECRMWKNSKEMLEEDSLRLKEEARKAKEAERAAREDQKFAKDKLSQVAAKESEFQTKFRELTGVVERLRSEAASTDREIAALRAETSASSLANESTRAIEQSWKEKLSAANKKHEELKAVHAAETKTLKDRLSVQGQDLVKLKQELADLNKQSNAAQEALDKEKADHMRTKERERASILELRRSAEEIVNEANIRLQAAVAEVERHKLEAARAASESARLAAELSAVRAVAAAASGAGGSSPAIPIPIVQPPAAHEFACSLCLEPYEGEAIVALPCGHVNSCGRFGCKKMLENRPTCTLCFKVKDASKPLMTIYLP